MNTSVEYQIQLLKQENSELLQENDLLKKHLDRAIADLTDMSERNQKLEKIVDKISDILQTQQSSKTIVIQ